MRLVHAATALIVLSLLPLLLVVLLDPSANPIGLGLLWIGPPLALVPAALDYPPALRSAPDRPKLGPPTRGVRP